MKIRDVSIIVALMLIITLVVAFNTGLIHAPQNGNQINKSNNTKNITPYIANNTYADNGLTFNYPADWQEVDVDNFKFVEGATVAFEDPNDNDTAFYIKSRDVGSLEEQVSIYKSEIAEIGQTVLSERNITINGMKAVEIIKTWPNDDKQYQALTIHIEAIPESLYYRIGCVTRAENFNVTRPKFELVVYSFKLQDQTQ